LVTVGRFTDDSEIGLFREHLLQSLAEDRMVVCDEEPNHGAAAMTG
jgi:hypothetical protein